MARRKKVTDHGVVVVAERDATPGEVNRLTKMGLAHDRQEAARRASAVLRATESIREHKPEYLRDVDVTYLVFGPTPRLVLFGPKTSERSGN